MSNVIRFLESMGTEAQWGKINKDMMELALADANVEPTLRSAILNSDAAQLQILLQQKTPVSYIIPGEEEEEEEESENEPGEKEVRRATPFSLASQQ